MKTKVKIISRWNHCGVPQVDAEYEDGTYETFSRHVFDAKVASGEFEVVKKWEDNGVEIK